MQANEEYYEWDRTPMQAARSSSCDNCGLPCHPDHTICLPCKFCVRIEISKGCAAALASFSGERVFVVNVTGDVSRITYATCMVGGTAKDVERAYRQRHRGDWTIEVLQHMGPVALAGERCESCSRKQRYSH